MPEVVIISIIFWDTLGGVFKMAAHNMEMELEMMTLKRRY